MRSVGKAKNIDGEWVFLFDNGAPALWTDLVSELKEVGGIVRMSFAAISTNGDGVQKASVVARLRMPKDVAWALCRSLHEMQGE
jgi:hypothetical protein